MFLDQFKIDPFNLPADFVTWIWSINKGWAKRIQYEPFNEYVAEAMAMSKDVVPDFSTMELEERNIAVPAEKKRIDGNTIYYMNGYVYLKDSTKKEGKKKMTLYPVQQVKAFLFDLGLNILEAKQRQIGGTSYYLPASLKRTICRKNYLSLFCCENNIKAESIFKDKLKDVFYEHPDFLKPSVEYNTKLGMSFGRKISGKASKEGLNSEIRITAPYATLINGEESDLVCIDEAAAIPILTEILDEGRPTIFSYNEDGKKYIKRQIIIWSSSNEGTNSKVSDSFEFEFKSLYQSFEKGIYSSGFIPLFFDYNTRFGYTEKQYIEEKKLAVIKADEGSQLSLIRFRKHNPESSEDFFLKTIETIIPYNLIADQGDKINNLIKRGSVNAQDGLIPQYGYFEPVYDTKRVMPEKDISPYAIIDAVWIPVSDKDSDRATTIITVHPNHKWKNRYYKGFDPVQDIGGHSKAASSVWDAQLKTIAAQMNYRPEQYKKTYEQSLLLNLYYTHPDHKREGIKELVEWNIGKEYVSYMERMGLDRCLIGKMELPVMLQTGEQWVGISKKTDNKEEIQRNTQELYYNYLKEIYFMNTVNQLKTYVKKSNMSKERYSFKPSDPKRDFDDCIDADTYSYIAWKCFAFIKPTEEEEKEVKIKTKHWVKEARGVGSYALVEKYF